MTELVVGLTLLMVDGEKAVGAMKTGERVERIMVTSGKEVGRDDEGLLVIQVRVSVDIGRGTGQSILVVYELGTVTYDAEFCSD